MDVYGKTLRDFYTFGETDTLWLHNSYGEAEEMPVEVFFRTEEEMPDLELEALLLCKGKILDVGAGAGSHTLVLQKRGADVTAIDISLNAVELMKERGIKKAIHQDFFTLTEHYDTLLFMMNGIGLCGTLQGLHRLLEHSKPLLQPGGLLIFDSSDISYLYKDILRTENRYFGEVDYCYEYKGQKGEWFHWLYIDQKTMSDIARQHGFSCQIISINEDDQYLAKLILAHP